MLDKSKHFRKTRGGNSRNSKTEYNLPEAKPELISTIRERMIKENKITRTIRLIISLVLVIVLIVVVYLLT